MVDRFQVNVKKDTLLMFQEDSDTPVASLAMDDLPTNTILEVMEKHQYLQLPRLSNQKVRRNIFKYPTWAWWARLF